jgi:hypothetical protein
MARTHQPVKAPSGVRLMPRRHPEDRAYTVISGVFYIGLGEEFDGDELDAYPPGSVIVLPGGIAHYHWARSGEYVTQIAEGAAEHRAARPRRQGPARLLVRRRIRDPRRGRCAARSG